MYETKKHLSNLLLKAFAFLCICMPMLLVSAQAQVKYDSSVVNQVVDSLFPGQNDAKILQIAVHIDGSSTDTIYTRQFDLHTNGTGNPALIESASMYYMGFNPSTSSPMDTVNLFGTVQNSVSGNFRFSDSIPLIKGVHYFMVCYNISHKSSTLDSFDARLISLNIDGKNHSPTVGAPHGNRKIAGYGRGIYCDVGRSTAGNFQIGPTHVQLGSLLSAYSDNGDIHTYEKSAIPVVKNQTYTLSLRTGPFSSENMRVWIDWDADGFFESDEVVYTANGIKASQRTEVAVKIPCDISLGQKRMRILSDFHQNSLAGACDDVDRGSGEDYILEVLEENKPTASFIKDTSVFESSVTLFINTSTAQGVDVSYEWDYDDDGKPDTNSVDLIITSGLNGRYPISLKTTLKSCDGTTTLSDTYNDTLVVKSVGSILPKAEFIASKNQILVGEEIGLTNLSSQSVFWKWSIHPSMKDGDSLFRFVNNTGSESKSPELVFNEPGSYSVVGFVSNKNGSDSLVKINYINVQNVITLCGGSSIQRDTLLAEHGVIVDDGGRDSVYSNFLNCSVLLQPTCADEVHLDLNDIDISRFKLLGYPGDFLKVYDGSDASGTALHSTIGYTNGIYSLNDQPSNLGRITASSGKMFITFQTDSLAAADGFELKYSISKKATPKPDASIVADDTVFVNHLSTLSAKDQRSWVNTYWDFNNDGVPDMEGSNVDYRWSTTGKFKVKLIVDACGAADTSVKTVVVVKPTAKPIADFNATFTRVSTKDTVQLLDASSNGPRVYRWEVSGGAVVRYLNETNSSSKNPEILLDSVGTYTVKLWVRNALGADSLTRTAYITVRNYCEPYVVSSLTKRGISRLSIKDLNGNVLIDNSSDDVSGYSDFSDLQRVHLERGAQYIVSVERSDTSFSIQRAFWLDLNSDGRFETAEKLLSETPGKEKIWVDTFIVPTSTSLGLGRIRVASNAASQTDYGCGPHVTGEFEDYACIVTRDVSPPLITLFGGDTLYVNQCQKFTDPGVRVIDNVDGDLTTAATFTGSVDVETPSWYKIVYTATDKSKNTASAERMVLVISDTIMPTIQLLGSNPLYMDVYQSYPDPGFKITDNCTELDTFYVTSTIDTAQLGTYERVITAIDMNGNKAVQKRTVVVQDTEAPVFTFLFNSDTLFIEGNGTYLDTGWVVSDNYDSSPDVSISGFVNTSVLDTYYVDYSITDTSKNGPVTATRVVIVSDNTPPEVKLSTKVFEIEVGRKVSLPEPWFGDSFDPNPELFQIGAYDKDVLGTTDIRYYAIDGSGNSSDTVVLQVIVYDDIAPLITLTDGPFINICRWSTFTDPGVELSDNYDDSASLSVETELLNSVNEVVSIEQMEQSEGFYTLTYEVEDLSGNKNTASRTIQVIPCNTLTQDHHNIQRVYSLYPNPTQDVLFIEGIESFEAAKIRVFDMLGREFELELIQSGEITIVPTSTLSKGSYILEVSELEGVNSMLFTISR